MAPGYSTEYLHVYLATGLTPAPLPADEDEDLRVERLTLTQIDALIRSGELHDAKTLAALYLYRLARAASSRRRQPLRPRGHSPQPEPEAEARGGGPGGGPTRRNGIWTAGGQVW